MNRFSINVNDISIIIPVKDNQSGINILLESFFFTQVKDSYPKEFIIVDNNSKRPIFVKKKYLNKGVNIFIEKCIKKGPAAARNIGGRKACGDWLLFIDSDCVFTESTIRGYLKLEYEGIAYAGKVLPYRQNIISNFYNSLNLLNPPISINDLNQAEYIVTANCLINKLIFLEVNGFDESFEIAGGEDVDLGIRLLEKGKIYYAKNSQVFHDYKNNLFSFYSRFYRYGIGLSMLEKKYNIVVDWMVMLPKNKGFVNYMLLILLKLAIKRGKGKYY